MGELANCTWCGQLFVANKLDLCQSCLKKEDKLFDTVYQYIRKKENRMATLPEVTEATDVEQKLIIKFIKQGRLRLAHFPNLGYPCEKCGETIQKDKLCQKCASSLKDALLKHETEEQKVQPSEIKTYLSHNKK